ncbi:hypothetical protein HYU13_02335 [Candidatus Woesearchaeota archaeon]|nr:hypothetical protein [Candidatus Woesearchaeota archaeon]
MAIQLSFFGRLQAEFYPRYRSLNEQNNAFEKLPAERTFADRMVMLKGPLTEKEIRERDVRDKIYSFCLKPLEELVGEKSTTILDPIVGEHTLIPFVRIDTPKFKRGDHKSIAQAFLLVGQMETWYYHLPSAFEEQKYLKGLKEELIKVFEEHVLYFGEPLQSGLLRA